MDAHAGPSKIVCHHRGNGSLRAGNTAPRISVSRLQVDPGSPSLPALENGFQNRQAWRKALLEMSPEDRAWREEILRLTKDHEEID